MRLLPCVLEALARIAVRRRLSRDETVRQLLAEHIAAQEVREPQERRTHISTVLRYPPSKPLTSGWTGSCGCGCRLGWWIGRGRCR